MSISNMVRFTNVRTEVAVPPAHCVCLPHDATGSPQGYVEDVSKLPMWRLLVRTTVEFEEDAASVQAMAEAMNVRGVGAHLQGCPPPHRLAFAFIQEAVSSDFTWSVEQLSTDVQDLGTTQDIMNFLFATMASVALFLCFFSLMASMVTNIREQTKEAGVLRALGLTYVAGALLC